VATGAAGPSAGRHPALACALAASFLLPFAPRPTPPRAGAAASPATAPADTTLLLPGLERPVRVVTDRYGVPHIRAAGERDLSFAWGFVSARDLLALWARHGNVPLYLSWERAEAAKGSALTLAPAPR
jgi:acyl-homoserine lactone acylase PvdQ